MERLRSKESLPQRFSGIAQHQTWDYRFLVNYSVHRPVVCSSHYSQFPEWHLVIFLRLFWEQEPNLINFIVRVNEVFWKNSKHIARDWLIGGRHVMPSVGVFISERNWLFVIFSPPPQHWGKQGCSGHSVLSSPVCQFCRWPCLPHTQLWRLHCMSPLSAEAVTLATNEDISCCGCHFSLLGPLIWGLQWDRNVKTVGEIKTISFSS